MEYITCIRTNKTVDGRFTRYAESWKVPNDFTFDEIKFLRELQMQDNLTVEESLACVRALRQHCP